jgi:hypothetical protein
MLLGLSHVRLALEDLGVIGLPAEPSLKVLLASGNGTKAGPVSETRSAVVSGAN